MRHVEEAMKQARRNCSIWPRVILCGMARGVDMMGKAWAEERGLEVEEWPAEWHRFGRRAGYLRNRAMAENADALVAVWDGKSRGTDNMMENARVLRLKTFVHEVRV